MNRLFRLLIPLVVCGCTATVRDRAVLVANTSADVANQSEQIAEDLDRLAQDTAIDQSSTRAEALAKLAAIRARYRRFFTAQRAFRLAWLGLAAYVKSFDATQAPDEARVAALQKAVQDAASALSAAALELEQSP